MKTLTRVARRLALISTFAAAALCTGPAVGSAAASGLIPTTTTVVASTDFIGPSGTTTLTATVKFGLLITPTGTVKFTDQSNGNALLGTARLSSPCLLWLKQCTATLVVSGSQLAGGQNVIQATYTGDLLSKPSSGTAFLYTPQNAGDNVQCSQSQFCTASDTSPDGTAGLTVNAGGSSNPGGETVMIAFSTQPLSCTTPSTGDGALFSVSDPTVSDVVTYDSFGAAADAAQAAHPIGAGGGGGYVCYSSPLSFTTASGAPAAKQPDGSFQGVLPACVFSEGQIVNPPCVSGSSFTSGEGGDTYETHVVVVPAQDTSGTDGDPHVSH